MFIKKKQKKNKRNNNFTVGAYVGHTSDIQRISC